MRQLLRFKNSRPIYFMPLLRRRRQRLRRLRKTSYGTALGFSGYHTGVYWDGYIPGNKEFVYSLTVTNSKPNDICFRYDNGISTWLTLGYDASFEDYSIITGVTLGYSDKTVSAIDTNVLPSNISDFGDAYGFNPYFRSTWGDLSFDAELMFVSVEYGKTRSNDIPMYTTRSATAIRGDFMFSPRIRFSSRKGSGK